MLMKTIAIVALAVTLFSAESKAAADIDPLPFRGAWIRTADAPLGARNYAAIAWAGNEILVIGGSEAFCPPAASCPPSLIPPLSDGAAYNPLTDSWRKIADAPVSVRWAETTTVGNDVFLLASTNYSYNPKRLLRYRLNQDNWDEVALPENMLEPAIAVIGRNTLLYYSRSDQNGLAAYWQLDTTTGEWTQLPRDSLGPGFSRQIIAVDGDFYLFDQAIVSSPGGADGPSYIRAARYRQQQWEILPVSNSVYFAPSLIAGGRLISPVLGCTDGGETDSYGRCVSFGAVFDTEANTWYELPEIPGHEAGGYTGYPGGFSESNLVISKPGYPALDATTNEWFIIPLLDLGGNIQRTVQSAGLYGFAFGGASEDGKLLKDAWIWKP